MVEFCFLQSLRLATQATSLYTREAHHHPTVHLKGVTHYTLRGRSVKRSTNKIARTPFDFSAGKPALWKAPLPAAVFSRLNLTFELFNLFLKQIVIESAINLRWLYIF